MAFVDLDGFEGVNDAYRHDVGDQFLIAVADRMRAALLAEDFAARLGGDEFVVIALGPEKSDQAQDAQRAFESRVFEATAGEYHLSAVSMQYPGASVGVLSVLPNRLDAEGALKAAEAVMYRIKQARDAKRPLADLRG